MEFFSLGDETIKPSDDVICFKPDISEALHIESLRFALARGNILNHDVQCCTLLMLDDRIHFCQFGGGGDIYLRLSGQLAVVGGDTNAIKLSQEDNRTCMNTSFEGKANSTDSTQLKYQLMANMVVAGFIDSVKDGKMEQSELVKLQKLSCYGMACTGASTFCFLKLVIDFSTNNMLFKFKVPMTTFPVRNTAAAIDLCIAYVMKKELQ